MFLANFSEMADLSGKMHIREWNDKVLGKSAIKKGGHFSRGRPFKGTSLGRELTEGVVGTEEEREEIGR